MFRRTISPGRTGVNRANGMISSVREDARQRGGPYGRSVVGHAILRARGPDALAGWDRAIAAGFAIGSLCFLIGPFPGFVQLVGAGADALIFFVGSIFFTFAAWLELRQATLRRGARFGADATWWSAAVQFVGTLLFNVDTSTPCRRAVLAPGGPAGLGARPRSGPPASWSPGVLAYRVAATRRARGPGVAHGRDQPRRLRAVRRLRDRVVRRAGHGVDPRPRRRQLDHRRSAPRASSSAPLLLWPSQHRRPTQEVTT